MIKAIDTSVDRRVPLSDPGHLVSLGFGLGLMPRAPGTWGALLGIPIFLALGSLGFLLYAALVAALFLIGVYVSGRTARALGVHDHGSIVIDEVVGVLVTWIAVSPGWFTIVAGFALFRFFDIVKPWPINWIDQRFQGGAGIMLDDLVAGIMAAAVLGLLLQVAPAGLIGA